MKKEILIILPIFFIFASCSKSISYDPFCSIPQKGIYEKREYSDGIFSVDPNDTAFIKNHSKTGYFKIEDIYLRKGYYEIMVQSDSIEPIFNFRGEIVDSSYIYYLIISLKTNKIKCCKKIVNEQRYELTLIPNVYYPPGLLAADLLVYVYTKGMNIPVGSASTIYTTPNLEGLYYIKQKKKTK